MCESRTFSRAMTAVPAASTSADLPPARSAPAGRARVVREAARAAGFDRVGITSADPAGAADLRQWLAEGRAGGMRYMAAYGDRRADPQFVLPGARSVIVVAVSHGDGERLEGR